MALLPPRHLDGCVRRLGGGGLAHAALAGCLAAAGCVGDETRTLGFDAGVAVSSAQPTAATSSSPAEGAGDPGASNADPTAGDNPSLPSLPAPEPSGQGEEPCDHDGVRGCEGRAVIETSPCDGTSRLLETCDAECDQGECVDCVPSSGVVCMGGAMHELDSCSRTGAKVRDCPFGCANGRCIEGACEPRAWFECVATLLVAVDSCGNQGNIESVCSGGCSDGTCRGCTDEGDRTCYDGDIYVLDSCGQIGARSTDCPGTCRTATDSDSAECVADGECESTAGIACALGDIHTVDGCGNVQSEVIQDCDNGCDADGCRPCQPRPVGTQCIGGSIHRLIGGCGEEPVPDAVPLAKCEFGCAAGNCLDSECSVGGGRTCNEGDVYGVDGCGNLGALFEPCSAGCADGACLPSPGPAGGNGGGANTGGSPNVDAGLGGAPPSAGAWDAGRVVDAGTRLDAASGP